jgi:hypothetical protein
MCSFKLHEDYKLICNQAQLPICNSDVQPIPSINDDATGDRLRATTGIRVPWTVWAIWATASVLAASANWYNGVRPTANAPAIFRSAASPTPTATFHAASVDWILPTSVSTTAAAAVLTTSSHRL